MKIEIYTGESIESKAIKELHPVTAFNYVEKIMKISLSPLNLKKEEIEQKEIIYTIYTNNPDIVSATKYLGIKYKIQTEFFLNGISHGENIETIFEDFNRSLDLLDNIEITI